MQNLHLVRSPDTRRTLHAGAGEVGQQHDDVLRRRLQRHPFNRTFLMIDPSDVHMAVEAVCPIFGVSIEDPNNRNTWSFVPAAEATQEQIDAGWRALQGFKEPRPQSAGGIIAE